MQKSFRDKVLDFFYPARCPVCDNVLAVGESGICPECLTRIKYIREPKCFRCGKPLEEEEEFCGDCRGKKYAFLSGNALLLYDGSMQESIARFKYYGRREYAGIYAQQLYKRYHKWIGQIRPDALIPVPIHRSRLNKRGYNQAELIAVHLGKMMQIKVRTDLLMRVRKTKPQKELTAAERLKNLEDAFCPGRGREELNRLPECVIIIDDIYTTGSTMEACSRVLRSIGISKIYFLCVCIGSGS